MAQTQITAHAASNVVFNFGACSIISPDPASSHPTYQTSKSRCRQQSCLRCWCRQSKRNILNQTNDSPVIKKKTPNVIALAFACAKYFGGSNKRPDHGLEVIEFFYASGCELQMSQLGGGREFKKAAKLTHGKWLNVKFKELGGTMMVSSNRAIDAWTREWVGYELCGEGSHDEKLECV
jgi:hypothetical protein